MYKKYLIIISSFLVFTKNMVHAQVEGEKYSWSNLPNIARPVFKKDTFNIEKYGAKQGLQINNAANINNAIGECSKKGGGVVLIHRGFWVTGPIIMKSNVNLHLDRSAILQFTGDKSQYRLIEGNYEGHKAIRNESPISGTGLTNIAISGAGIIDGNGDGWRAMGKAAVTELKWAEMIKTGVVSKDNRTWYPSESYALGVQNNTSGLIEPGKTMKDYLDMKDYYRPNLLVLNNCKKVLLQSVTFQNSPAWCLHTLLCKDVTFDNIHVSNPPNAQNGDGLDIESCKNVLIQNCTIDAGDDAICIKSGKDEEGRKRGVPTENVVVRNNVVYHGHGGFVIGSEMSGGAKNIFVSDCSFIGTDIGLRFKTTRGRGGMVENIYIKNITMRNILREAILFDMYYFASAVSLKQTGGIANKPPVTDGTPQFRNFQLKNIVCDGAERALMIRGLPEMSIKDIHMEDIQISSASGAEFIDAENISLKNSLLVIRGDGPLVSLENSRNIQFENIQNLNTGLLFSVNGDLCKDIRVINISASNVVTESEFKFGASKQALLVSKNSRYVTNKPNTSFITGARDTSFNNESARLHELKAHPDIVIVADLPSPQVKEERNIPYRTIGKHSLMMDAFTPAVKKSGKIPALLIIHGGGWRSGNYKQHTPLAQRLAKEGYAAFTVEYRLSTEALYPAAVYDVKAALKWLRANAEKFGVDTSKLAVIGFSAGGQLAALVGATSGDQAFEEKTKGNSKVQAVVDIDGTLSFIHPESREAGDDNNPSAAAKWLGFSRNNAPELWGEASPLNHARNNTAPFLFLNSSAEWMHAGRDDFMKTMQKKGIYTEVHTFEKSPHTFCLFNPWFEPTAQYIIAFLNKVLK